MFCEEMLSKLSFLTMTGCKLTLFELQVIKSWVNKTVEVAAIQCIVSIKNHIIDNLLIV